MNVLITGTRGYVGDHLVRYLRKRGIEVVEFVGNITDPNIENQPSSDVVIHLAAKIDDRRNDKYFEVNVGGGNEHYSSLHGAEHPSNLH